MLVVHALACMLRLQRLLWMRVRVRVVHALAGMLRHQRLRGRMKLVLILLRMRRILRMSGIL